MPMRSAPHDARDADLSLAGLLFSCIALGAAGYLVGFGVGVLIYLATGALWAYNAVAITVALGLVASTFQLNRSLLVRGLIMSAVLGFGIALVLDAFWLMP